MSDIKVLIVDDEQELRKSIRAVLVSKVQDKEITFAEAEDGLQAVEMMREQNYDIVLMDVKMPKLNGLEALNEIKKFNTSAFIVILTAHSNLQDAVIAIKAGAYDYLAKPVNPEQLMNIVNKSIETQEMVTNLAMSNPIFDDDVETDLVGSSEKMNQVYDLIGKLSHVDTTVLVRGQNGTGKELVARTIHQSSPRKHEEFISLDCSLLSDEDFEKELFGFEKGAFKGADTRQIGKLQIATNGTLFIDEVSSLGLEMQAKILLYLQEKTFTPVGGSRQLKSNARLIFSSSNNLEKLIEDNKFRDDLFFKISIMPIYLPALNERIEDIERLTDSFIKKFNTKNNKNIEGISQEALETLRAYSWPGNLVELQNCIERAVLITNGTHIEKQSLPEQILESSENLVKVNYSQSYKGELDFDSFKAGAEKEFIVSALKANNGKINKTVAHANIPKNTLLRKIKKYNIDVKQFY